MCSTQLPATVSLCMELTVLEALARKSYPAARRAPKLPAGSVSGNPKDGIWLALGPSSWPRQAEPEDQGQEPSSACADTERSHRQTALSSLGHLSLPPGRRLLSPPRTVPQAKARGKSSLPGPPGHARRLLGQRAGTSRVQSCGFSRAAQKGATLPPT